MTIIVTMILLLLARGCAACTVSNAANLPQMLGMRPYVKLACVATHAETVSCAQVGVRKAICAGTWIDGCIYLYPKQFV